ncbi:ABC transporter permease subunit [Actinophytocola gossypii]|uniref:ABC transporter permease subunit n=1 Tax=Actinophytocola gossypii TaxID=2812003 RepID=A0ABT2JK23_9PSEU|nr:ABC transporter permease subunit [Actinophytocola gossypii]MCT2588240.1 ABC transporter permease subunit [Actinophytocola gossypii]
MTRHPTVEVTTRFTGVLAGEWVKLSTVRSTRWAPVVLVLVTVGVAFLGGITESIQRGETILGSTANGSVLGMLVAGLLGAMAMSNEYGTGTIRATFGACPRRLPVLGAKVAVVATLVFVVALLACAGALLTGLAVLSGKGYATGDPLPALLGMAACFAAVAVLGLAAAAILRHAAAAVVAVVGVVLLPSLLGPLFGAWQRWVVGASPMAAVQKLAQSTDAAPDAPGGLGPWQSLGLVGAYTLAALVVAGWLLRRRDV